MNISRLRVNARHWSINGEYFEEVDNELNHNKASFGFLKDRFYFNTPRLGMVFQYVPKPVVHNTGDKFNYYSIPSIQGKGFLYPIPVNAVGWFDHEWTERPEDVHVKNWDWIGLHLDCGIRIMAYSSKDLKFCDISIGEAKIETDFILEGKHLFLHRMGMYLLMEPIEEEKVFNPKFGLDYSEQPFSVVSKGGIIGYGMRERTHGGDKWMVG